MRSVPVSGLVEFLLARIAEDEAAARAASPGGWTYGGVASVDGGMLYDETRTIANLVYEQPDAHDGTIVRHLLVPEADANGQHITRHDPSRVLAECEAKRRIVEMHRADGAPVVDLLGMEYEFCWTCSDSGPDAQAWPCDTIKALAAVYADHPDYRDEWRP